MTSSYDNICNKIRAKLECEKDAECVTFEEMKYFMSVLFSDDIHYVENDQWINYCLVNTNDYNNGDWLYF